MPAGGLAPVTLRDGRRALGDPAWAFVLPVLPAPWSLDGPGWPGAYRAYGKFSLIFFSSMGVR